jgi:protein-L-isoaspartate(D-aspartate) O-methyltransferase
MKFEEQRKRMIDEQIAARGIRDPLVLKAFERVPRHSFVPGPFDVASYADRPLPIGRGQTISQPYMVALMTECLSLKGGEKVLEIGTGSGYQAAILAEICKEVYTVERDPELVKKAEHTLKELGYGNIYFNNDDGTLGWQEHVPYDGIIVTAAAPYVPEALKKQLADGGRLVIPVGHLYGQMLVVVTRNGEEYSSRDVCGCVFVPLIGEDGWREEA